MSNKILTLLVLILFFNIFGIILNSLFLTEILRKLNHLSKIEIELRALKFNIINTNSLLKIKDELNKNRRINNRCEKK
jgi:hypothetical protein